MHNLITSSHVRNYVIFLAWIFFISGCSCQEDPDVAIRVGDKTVTADQLLAIAKAQGEATTLEPLSRLAQLTAEDLAAEHRLVAEGWDRNPQFIQAQRRFVRSYVNARINEEFMELLSVSDEEISEYFEARRDAYRKPAQVRVALIEISVEQHGQQAAALANEIYTVLTSMDKGPERDKRFNEFVVARSAHLASRFQGGDVGYMARNDSAWPAALIEAVFSTSLDASIGPMVKTPNGFYVFRVLGFRDAVEPRLSDYRESVRKKILAKKQDNMRHEARVRLVEDVSIEIDQEAIIKIASPSNDSRPTPSPTPAG